MSSLCEVRERLQLDFLEASVMLRTCLNSQTYAVASGRVDADLEARIAKAQANRQTAKAALLRHIREHACSTIVLSRSG
jgi:hypothetical protein